MYNVDDAENTWFYMQYMIKNINKSLVLFFNCYRKVKSSHSFFCFFIQLIPFDPKKEKCFVFQVRFLCFKINVANQSIFGSILPIFEKTTELPKDTRTQNSSLGHRRCYYNVFAPLLR